MKAFFLQNKIFVFCTILFCFWYIDVWENSNACSRVLPIATFFENGNFILDPYKDKTIDISYVNGHYYMDKAPLPTFITLPFFAVLKWTGIVKPNNGSYYSKSIYLTGAIVCGIIPFLLILFQVAQHLVIKQREDLILMAFIAFLSSFIFVFAGTFFAHVLAACLLLLAYLHYQKEAYFAAGIFCGLGFLTEFTTIWILFAWIFIEIMKHKSFKNALFIALGFLPALLIILGYNYYFTGNPLTMLYLFVADNFDAATKSTYGISFPKFKALYGLVFSQNRGLLFYAPVLLYGLFVFFSDESKNWLVKIKSYVWHPVFLPFILTLLFISSHAAWEGGWTYGPRHLTTVTTLLIFTLIQSNLFGNYKTVFWLIAVYGIACTFLAKLTVLYSVPELDENILSYLISKLKDSFNDGNVFSLLTKQKPFFAFIIFVGLFGLMCTTKPTKSKKITEQL